MNKKGVFGLTSVQAFFAIILAVALLAYVIVIVLGTLQGANILTSTSATIGDENITSLLSTGVALTEATKPGCTITSLTMWNATSGATVTSGNYTLNSPYGCYLTGLDTTSYADSDSIVNVTATYTYWTNAQQNTNGILRNTSLGVTSFFGSITPVYAILAVLVIILVLVVLVRVVTGGTVGKSSAEAPL